MIFISSEHKSQGRPEGPERDRDREREKERERVSERGSKREQKSPQNRLDELNRVHPRNDFQIKVRVGRKADPNLGESAQPHQLSTKDNTAKIE